MIPPGVNVAEADTATDGRGVDARFPVDELGKERIDGGFEVRIVREGVKPLPEHDFPGAFPRRRARRRPSRPRGTRQ